MLGWQDSDGLQHPEGINSLPHSRSGQGQENHRQKGREDCRAQEEDRNSAEVRRGDVCRASQHTDEHREGWTVPQKQSQNPLQMQQNIPNIPRYILAGDPQQVFAEVLQECSIEDLQGALDGHKASNDETVRTLFWFPKMCGNMV